MGGIGAVAGLAAPLSSALAPATAVAGSPAGSPFDAGAAGSPPVTGLMLGSASSKGMDDLEALAILALLAGNHRDHGADALGAMLVTLALHAYSSVQSMGSNPGLLSGVPSAGAGLSIRA